MMIIRKLFNWTLNGFSRYTNEKGTIYKEKLKKIKLTAVLILVVEFVKLLKMVICL